MLFVLSGKSMPCERMHDETSNWAGRNLFQGEDPKALYQWYRKHLGIESAADGSGAMWRDADHLEVPGVNVWAIFPQETKYFDPSHSSFMINFRVEISSC